MWGLSHGKTTTLHMSKEEYQRQLKEIVVARAREIIANREQEADRARTARQLFKALCDAPVWTIATSAKPEGFAEPEEIWSQPVTVNDKRRPDDSTG
jgi:hypothetical protein